MSDEPHGLVWDSIPPVPDGVRPFGNQVAGHIFGRPNGFKKNHIGFLQNDSGTIFKPLQGLKKGERELEFYRIVFDPNTSDEDLLQLRHFLPWFHGTWTAKEHPGLVYLSLEDVTSKFKNPCIMDVKVGPVTYDQEADAFKISREKGKFPDLIEVGFQLVGIKVLIPDSNQYKSLDRTYLRSLNKYTILTEGLKPFFDCSDPFKPLLIKSILSRLRKIESWFLSQRKFSFKASSLLFVYDGFHLTRTLCNSCNAHQQTADSRCQLLCSENLNRQRFPLDAIIDNSRLHSRFNSPTKEIKNIEEKDLLDDHVDVRMIDFTHVFPSDCLDENYLIGLRSLIKYIERLI